MRAGQGEQGCGQESGSPVESVSGAGKRMDRPLQEQMRAGGGETWVAGNYIAWLV